MSTRPTQETDEFADNSFVYSLSLYYRVEPVMTKYLSSGTQNLADMPIKRLLVDLSYGWIIDLIMLLKNLPYVTYLSIQSFIFEVKYKPDEIDKQFRHGDIKYIEIKSVPSVPKLLTWLLKSFPRVTHLEMNCENYSPDLREMFDVKLRNDLSNARFLRSVTFVNLKEQESVKVLESIVKEENLRYNGKRFFGYSIKHQLTKLSLEWKPLK